MVIVRLQVSQDCIDARSSWNQPNNSYSINNQCLVASVPAQSGKIRQKVNVRSVDCRESAGTCSNNNNNNKLAIFIKKCLRLGLQIAALVLGVCVAQTWSFDRTLTRDHSDARPGTALSKFVHFRPPHVNAVHSPE